MSDTVSSKDIRAINLIRSSIQNLALSLDGYTVLTEVGSGMYKYTPLIAAMSGASKVYAWTRDSSYGLAENNIAEAVKLLEYQDCVHKVVFTANERNIKQIQEADIITNSGFLRPLNQAFLEQVSTKAVIPLMFEAWELRGEDIDIDYCKQKGIKVAGTWENHPLIQVFDQVGTLALKLALNAGMEVKHNNIIIWSDDHFGEMAQLAFESIGASNVIVTTDLEVLYKYSVDADFIYLADYSEKRVIIGETGFMDLNKIITNNQALTIVHLYGAIDLAYAQSKGVHVYPSKNGASQVMSETLGYVGLKPIINLQVAGFKVAQELLQNQLSDLSQPI